MKRRIVAITAIPVRRTSPTGVLEHFGVLYALADDGTVWEKPLENPWYRLPSLPDGPDD